MLVERRTGQLGMMPPMHAKVPTAVRQGVPKAGRWLADHILGTLIGLVVAAMVGAAIAALWPSGAHAPLSLAAQWARERARIAAEGWEVTTDRQAELVGDTEPVTILGLHRLEGECSKTAQRSDEMRIYTVTGGQLQRAFSYEPSATGCRAWVFQLASAADLTGSGRSLAFGEFSGGSTAEPTESVPVAIGWDSTARQYVVTPLIAEAPGVMLQVKHGEGQGEVFQTRMRQMFTTPVRLTPSTPPAYGLYEFQIVPRGAEETFIYGLYRLTSGVAAAGPSGPTAEAPIVYQRAQWHVELREGKIAAGWCQLPKHEEVAIVRPQADSSAILQHLANSRTRWINSCEAPLTSEWWEAHHPE
jgi:hypothetical protein